MNLSRRLTIVVVLVVSLIAAGVTRQMASTQRSAGRRLGASTGGDAAQLGRMNSFALTLLLGGLRGPLVMILWSSSETQKSEKNLQDFDTKVEWIRLLQPEFDSVHIFQMWNKAYNISVQMASLSNKYLTIIDAIDFGERVDRGRPDNISILYQIGSIFGDKLGDSAEKEYYSRRVRAESLPHPARQKLAQTDPGYRPLELDSIVDDKGNILPQYLKPSAVRLTDSQTGETYDGSELQFIRKFEPFPTGVGPYGFAYAYRKRAQLLQRAGFQKHAQLSEMVIDSRPAMDLKKWGEAEWRQARALEIRAINQPVPAERIDMEAVAQNAPVDQRFDDAHKAMLRDAIVSFELALRVWAASDAEYIEHLKRYQQNVAQYESHRAEIAADSALVAADRDYTLAMLAEPAQRAPLLSSARENYRRAIVRYSLIVLRYYIPAEVGVKTLPEGVTQANFAARMLPDQITPEQIVPMVKDSVELAEQMGFRADEINEYVTYAARAQARLKLIPQ